MYRFGVIYYFISSIIIFSDKVIKEVSILNFRLQVRVLISDWPRPETKFNYFIRHEEKNLVLIN